jgi:diacylglycerol kinase (ATP)
MSPEHDLNVKAVIDHPAVGLKGWARLQSAARNSLQGFAATYRHEEAFRQEAWLTLVLLPLGLWLGETGVERVLLAGSWLLVPLVELMNSAVESAIDRIGPERHPLSGRSKDQASAAVLLAIGLAVMTWLLILLD